MRVKLKRLEMAGERRLESHRRRVEAALRSALGARTGAPAAIHQAMRYSVLSGGKRLRPLLCLLACEAVGGRAHDALPAACGLELLHTYSLIHDDLPAMDDAATRRGRASSHRKFGEATAILTGDALLTLAFAYLARGPHPERQLRVVQDVARWAGTQGLIGGQVLDLRWQNGNGHRLRLPVLDQIASRKTAALIGVSVRAGAIVGGASAKQLRSLTRYGTAVGMTFQMVDDLLDGEGYACALGREAARRRAGTFVARADRAVGPLGRRGEPLRRLAHDLLERSV